MTPDKNDLQFAAEMSFRYHQRRATVLSRFDTTVNWLTLSTAAGSFLFLIGGAEAWPAKVLTAITTMLAITQIAFNVGKAASKHEDWYARWVAFLAEIQTCEAPTPEQLCGWIKRRAALEAEYPHQLRGLATDCRNQAIEALNLDDGELRVIQPYQKMLLHLCDLQRDFPKLNRSTPVENAARVPSRAGVS